MARQPSCWHRVTAGWNERNQWHTSLHHLLMFLRDLQGGDIGQESWSDCCHQTNEGPKPPARGTFQKQNVCECVYVYVRVCVFCVCVFYSALLLLHILLLSSYESHCTCLAYRSLLKKKKKYKVILSAPLSFASIQFIVSQKMYAFIYVLVVCDLCRVSCYGFRGLISCL